MAFLSHPPPNSDNTLEKDQTSLFCERIMIVKIKPWHKFLPDFGYF